MSNDIELDTVALARKYNLIETFYVPGYEKETVETESKESDSQDLSHLVVIDFESTCWETKDAKTLKSQPEIIEFPAVLVNLDNGQILDEFHHFVMPIDNPKLSDFCKKFTGITQEQVDNAAPLKTCIHLFKMWIKKITIQYRLNWFGMTGPMNCALATWTDWDLGVCLLGECNKKLIQKPDVFNRWVNLKEIYKQFYQRKLHGLKGALNELGIPFEGREHSGIWDARNTAKLAFKIRKDGFKLKITKDIGKQNLLK